MAEASSGPWLLRHRGTRAVSRLVEFAPSTGGLALWVKHEDRAAGEGALLVSTDGNTLFYGDGFAELSVARQAGLVAHEVLHIALRHPQRYLDLQALLGDVDLDLFTTCADAIVNSALGHLTWLELPASSVFLERLLARALGEELSVDKALLEWDVERLYRAIDDRKTRREPQGRRAGRQGRAGGEGSPTTSRASGAPSREPSASRASGGREDGPRAAQVRAMGGERVADLLPRADAPGAPEGEAEEARTWSERLVRGHAGDGAHSMLRVLLADRPRSRTPWEQVLRTQLARALSPSRGVSWSRPARSYIANQGRAGPNRRMPWEPGFSGTRSVPRLAVLVDISGSIDQALVARFAREVEAITRRLEAGLVLIVGDDCVRRVAHFPAGQADLGALEVHGGGGTDFTPLLEEADTHRPDIAVVLTDLDGPARFRPSWPVLWAVPESHAQAVPPFGRKLVLTMA